MSRLLVFALVVVSLLIGSFSPLLAAESTDDVVVDTAKKEQARQEILGEGAGIAVGPEYRIGYRDILYVGMLGEGSMAAGPAGGGESAGAGAEKGASDSVRGRGNGIEVQTDGRISLRYIGDVHVVGMTLTQLADYLKKLYAEINQSPSITVTLIQSNSRQYTVMGQVKEPGIYHLDFPMDVAQVVAKAGGFTEWANSEVTVIRQNAGGEQGGQGPKSFDFDYNDFLKGKNLEDNIKIMPGDYIVAH